MAVVALLLDQIDRLRARAEDRLAGLSDTELLWEPVPGCWSVRRSGEVSGMRLRGPGAEWDLDAAWPDPDPAPFTTIAWRLVHMADIAEVVAMQLGDHDPAAELTRPMADRFPASMRASAPHRAVDCVGYWLDAITAVRLALAREDDTTLQRPAVAPWETEATPLLHSVWVRGVEEQVHHAAEIGVLRDLWRFQEH